MEKLSKLGYLILFFILISLNAEASTIEIRDNKIKYFQSIYCGPMASGFLKTHLFKFNDTCKFSKPFDDDFTGDCVICFRTHYKNNKPHKAFLEINENRLRGKHNFKKGSLVVMDMLEFDSNGRIATYTRNLNKYEILSRNYRLCKFQYEKQLIRQTCFDGRNKFLNKRIFEFKNNDIARTSEYNKFNQLTHYIDYDHKTHIARTFKANNVLIDQVNLYEDDID